MKATKTLAFDSLSWKRRYQVASYDAAQLRMTTEFLHALLEAADDMQATIAVYRECGSPVASQGLDDSANRLRDLLELWNKRDS